MECNLCNDLTKLSIGSRVRGTVVEGSFHPVYDSRVRGNIRDDHNEGDQVLYTGFGEIRTDSVGVGSTECNLG